MTDVKSFMVQNGFTQVVNHVRVNTNGFLFLTFISAANVAENVYFSKAASKRFAEGQAVAKGFFSNLRIWEGTNAAGEQRTKIALEGESLRIDLEDLF